MSAMEVCTDTRVDSWEFANTLGEGAYGEVKLAINTRNQETRAIKIISLNLLNDKTPIQKEVLIHKTLNHENIIKYYSSFQQLDKFYIILEYASGGELFDRIEPDFGMDANLAHKYFQQLINGVEYLHSKGIVHRDIKPENLLLNDMDQIKIADFGLATLFQYRGNERLLTSPCGTAPYVAPEVLCRNEYRAQPTDVWSTGIVLIAMLAGELPWDKPVFECPEFISWIKNNSYAKSPWCKIENSALSLIKNILNYEPEQRFTMRQIKESAWYKRVAKNVHYTSMIDQNNENGFLSQPTYVYLNDKAYGCASSQSAFMSSMAAELNMTDSQQNCECSSTHHVESFSQPISTDNMILNSQINATQPSSQYSQSPFLRMVKRLTRVFMHSSLDICTEKVKEVLQKLMYDFKLTNLNQSQRQITVITSDKRQTLLTFKINIIEMNSQSGVLVDFRLSKGDGLEFKKIFMKIKANLSTYVCKRYVFVNSHACCEKQYHC